MNRCQIYACNQIFHNYPAHFTLEQLEELCFDEDLREEHNEFYELSDINNMDESLILCEECENISWYKIPELINEIIKNLHSHFPELIGL